MHRQEPGQAREPHRPAPLHPVPSADSSEERASDLPASARRATGGLPEPASQARPEPSGTFHRCCPNCRHCYHRCCPTNHRSNGRWSPNCRASHCCGDDGTNGANAETGGGDARSCRRCSPNFHRCYPSYRRCCPSFPRNHRWIPTNGPNRLERARPWRPTQRPTKPFPTACPSTTKLPCHTPPNFDSPSQSLDSETVMRITGKLRNSRMLA